MATEIYLVKVGMTMTEGIVEEWYVADGGSVNQGDLLYRLETEKINMDVDADASGIVKHSVAVGVTKEPGDVIGYIYAPGEAIPSAAPSGAAPPAATPAPVAAATLPAATHPANQQSADGRVLASPAARKLANELNVDMATVRGTGPGGRITKEDVEHAAAQPAPAAAKAPIAAAPSAAAGERIAVKGIRKTIATRMFDSLRTSAQLTMDMDVNMDDAVKLRGQLITEWESAKIRPTYTDLVVKAAAKALKAHPLMNSAFGETEIALLPDVHVGVAVAIDAGLVVPVIRHADRLSLRELAIDSARLAAAARDGKLNLDDMAGGTFTVSALGMYGVDSFTPILNAPQSGILGVNRIRNDVAWDGDRPVKRSVMRLSLTWDHRVLDGAPAAQFLGAVRDLLEAPYRLLV